MRLEKTLLSRIEALAGRAGNTAFRQRKHALIAECLRLQETGGKNGKADGNPANRLGHIE